VEFNLQTISSPLATQLPQAVGAAYALKVGLLLVQVVQKIAGCCGAAYALKVGLLLGCEGGGAAGAAWASMVGLFLV
jgi:TPP-dependent pyruvate/acetoin dehydrogenase alpha subunit